jgi:hypothetical protein
VEEIDTAVRLVIEAEYAGAFEGFLRDLRSRLADAVGVFTSRMHFTNRVRTWADRPIGGIKCVQMTPPVRYVDGRRVDRPAMWRIEIVPEGAQEPEHVEEKPTEVEEVEEVEEVIDGPIDGRQALTDATPFDPSGGQPRRCTGTNRTDGLPCSLPPSAGETTCWHHSKPAEAAEAAEAEHVADVAARDPWAVREVLTRERSITLTPAMIATMLSDALDCTVPEDALMSAVIDYADGTHLGDFTDGIEVAWIERVES